MGIQDCHSQRNMCTELGRKFVQPGCLCLNVTFEPCVAVQGLWTTPKQARRSVSSSRRRSRTVSSSDSGWYRGSGSGSGSSSSSSRRRRRGGGGGI